MSVNNDPRSSQQGTITTHRLLLRSFNSSDAVDVERLAGDKGVALMTGRIPHPYPSGAALSWIEHTRDLIDDGLLRQFAITLRATRQLVGCLGLRKENTNRSKAELAYWLGKEYWGKGYMPEAARAAIDQTSVEFGVKEVWANVLPENRRSVRVLRKIGMVYHARFHQNHDEREGMIALLHYRMKPVS